MCQVLELYISHLQMSKLSNDAFSELATYMLKAFDNLFILTMADGFIISKPDVLVKEWITW